MKNSADQPRDHDPQVQTPSLPSDKGGASKEKTQYEVGAVEATTALPSTPAKATAAIRAPGKKVAVFVAHGMGQQIPFQTLDQVATRLLDQDGGGNPPDRKVVRAVKFNDQWLHRIELKLRSGTANPVEAHVYEGYWAPLTEGKITARGATGLWSEVATSAGISLASTGGSVLAFHACEDLGAKKSLADGRSTPIL